MSQRLFPLQVAYVVDDVVEAARDHHRTFGSGPFFIVEHIPFVTARYRGQEAVFDHSAAYGSWGGVIVEFMCQHDARPSAVRDMYPQGMSGFHHIASLVDNIDEARAEMARLGFDEAFYAAMANGLEIFMFDARAVYGHFIELFQDGPEFRSLFEFIRRASDGFTREDPIRPLDFSML